MILDDIKISYPYLNYEVEVVHFTSRKSTAIEWVILEVIARFSDDMKYNSMTVDSVFERILQIRDSDLLIKPCINDLINLGAITISNFNDNVSLSEIMLRDVAMTRTGKEMQSRGLLPGEESGNKIKVNLDILEDKLFTSEARLHEHAAGTPIIDMGDREVQFPHALIQKKLEGDKSKKTYQWLQSTTEIKELRNNGERLLWRNCNKQVWIGGNGYVSMEDIPGAYTSKLIKEALKNHDWTTESYEWHRVAPTDIDKEYDAIYYVDSIPQRVGEMISKNSVVAIHNDFWTSQYKTDNKIINAIFCFGSPSLQSELREDKAFIVHIPEEMPVPGCIGFSERTNIFGAMFDLYTDEDSVPCKLGYSKSEFNEVSVKDVLNEIIEKYSGTDPKLLALHMINKNEEKLKQGLRAVFKQIKGIDNQINALEEVTAVCKKLTYKEINVDTLLIERIQEEFFDEKDLTSFNEVIEQSRLITSYAFLKTRENVMKQMINLILQNVNYLTHYQQVKELFNYFVEDKMIAKSWFMTNGLFNNIYNPSVIRSLFENILDDKQSVEYTEVERSFNTMKSILQNLMKLCENMNLSEICSREEIIEMLLDKPSEIPHIHRQLRNWKESKSKLSNKIPGLNEMLNEVSVVKRIEDNIDLLRETVGYFVDDTLLSYDKVYIIDSCSIVDKPDLLNLFNDKELVILPTTVLQELDGLKNHENGEVAYNAREVIRAVDTDSKIKVENAHPELLPIDLNPEVPDNLILSIALKYITKSPMLITEDANLRNIAKAQHISTTNIEGIYRKKQQDKRDEEANKAGSKKKKSKKKK